MSSGPALCSAASAGDLQRCAELLKEGADVNEADVFKQTPLINATVAGHAEVVKVLAAARANLASADRSGWSALHWAAFQGSCDMVRLCLALGADAQQKDLKGSTPREARSFESLGMATATSAHMHVSQIKYLVGSVARGCTTRMLSIRITANQYTHTYTHTYMYVYIYIYIHNIYIYIYVDLLTYCS
ncbi:KIDINS220 [Symbiodinium sp. CCMP2592]|nr:KIDINS220 [Symbiodinium sp. CCMP2592]